MIDLNKNHLPSNIIKFSLLYHVLSPFVSINRKKNPYVISSVICEKSIVTSLLQCNIKNLLHGYFHCLLVRCVINKVQ